MSRDNIADWSIPVLLHCKRHAVVRRADAERVRTRTQTLRVIDRIIVEAHEAFRCPSRWFADVVPPRAQVAWSVSNIGSGLAGTQLVTAAPTGLGLPVFEMWDPRAALVALARAVLNRARFSRDARCWFVMWPALPEPALYVAVASAPMSTEACAA